MFRKFFDIAHSIRVSPLSFRWLRPKDPVALSAVCVTESTAREIQVVEMDVGLLVEGRKGGFPKGQVYY